MDRGRRNASRTDAAKEKLAALAAQKQSGKKRVETFEAKREEAVYDEVRRRGRSAAARRAHVFPPELRGVHRLSRASPARAAQLDEKSYANLVAKRRMETGGFVVGDVEGGCARRGVAREGHNSKQRAAGLTLAPHPAATRTSARRTTGRLPTATRSPRTATRRRRAASRPKSRPRARMAR
jgi:hypothetical protein